MKEDNSPFLELKNNNMTKIIKIQQEKWKKGGKVPKPYFILSRNGLVQKQGFWKGVPFKLLGFCKEKKTGKMEKTVADFFFYPEQVIGMYPVFEVKTKKGERRKIFTSYSRVESIEKIGWKKKSKNGEITK